LEVLKTFSNLTIISPEFFPFLLMRGFLRPFEGEPKIYPTVLSAFPTSLGGFA